ncbi:MAG: type II secretion system F family protein [Nitrospinota bacterium]|nr:type II secretion system F family protein [Nitrospinota bacterium]
MKIEYIIGFSAWMCICFVILLMRKLYRKMPKVGKALEPRPPALKWVMPLVALVNNVIGSYLTVDYLEGVNAKLKRVGVETFISAEEFTSLRVVTMGFGFVLGWYLANMLTPENARLSILLILATSGMGLFYPNIWLNDLRQRQVNEILKTLPTYLDYITLAVEAGLNLSGAIDQSVDKGPEGPLRSELRKVLRDIKAGLTKSEALQAMSDRLDITSLRSVISSIVQAEKMGANLAPALRILAQQRRIERFQRAEKQAMEAPVKLLFPLVAFIFPVTFIILMFPIVMKFYQEGIL